MKSKKTLLMIILAFALLIGGATVLYTRLGQDISPDQLHGNAGDNQGTALPAPDFVVYDANGKEVRLSDYIGKPIVLNFWASWCGPCQMEMPDFDEKYLELGADVVFLMVNMTDGARETVESASAFVSGKGYSFPVLFDTHYSAATAYSVYSLPTTYFIDAEGNIVSKYSGAISGDTLQKNIDKIT